MGLSGRSSSRSPALGIAPCLLVALAALLAGCGGSAASSPGLSVPVSSAASSLAEPSSASPSPAAPSPGPPSPSPDVVVGFGAQIDDFVPGDLAFDAEGRPIVVGEAFRSGIGVVGRSDDGGRTWQLGETGLGSILSVTSAVGRLWIVASNRADPSGRSNPLLESADGGTSWTLLGPVALRDPVFVDAASGWAIPIGLSEAAGSVLVATGDGGRTWVPLLGPCSGGTPYLTGLAASADHRVWVACSGEGATGMSAKAIYVARDGLGPWELRAAAPPPGQPTVGAGLTLSGHVTSLAAFGDVLVLVLSRSFSLRSTDGGRSWTELRVGSPDVAEPESIAIADGTALAALVRDPDARQVEFFWSSNGGATWEMRHAWRLPD